MSTYPKQLRCIEDCPLSPNDKYSLTVGDIYNIVGEQKWYGIIYYQVEIGGRVFLYLKRRFVNE
jgi:hypothetical protein